MASCSPGIAHLSIYYFKGYMYLEKIQNKLVVQGLLLLFVLITFATVVRPILVEQSWVLTAIGCINSLMIGSLWLYMRKRSISSWHRLLVILVGFVTLIPITTISGGVNSQFAILLPALPVFVCSIMGVRSSWLVTGFITTFVILLIVLNDKLPNVSLAPEDLTKTYARAFWICMSSLMSSIFASIFYNINFKLNAKLHAQAFEDGLTKVPNRRSIIDHIEASFLTNTQTNTMMSVIMLDVDDFKSLNDTYGHVAGDKCLQRVAKILSENIRQNYDQVGRYGGEEFLVVLNNTDKQTAHRIADTLRTKIADSRISIDSHDDIKLTSTFGVATYNVNEPWCASSATMLIQQADEALYSGKASGKNCVRLFEAN